MFVIHKLPNIFYQELLILTVQFHKEKKKEKEKSHIFRSQVQAYEICNKCGNTIVIHQLPLVKGIVTLSKLSDALQHLDTIC